MDVEQKINYLKMVDIFQDLSKAEMEEMDRTTTMSTCQRGKIFYRPEDQSEVLFILKKGRVQLYRLSTDGKKLVVATIDAGTIFGEMAIIGQGMQNTFAEAADDCLLCVMSRPDVERLVLSKPAVALRIMRVMAGRLRRAEMQLEEIAFRSIPSRLAALILRLRREQGDIIYGYTHQDLADAIGTYRETATQALNDFKAKGLLDIGRKRIEVLDAEGLEAVAAT
ncbi:MAG TPA: Crp/Fnr family transcriptional regulator [Anaerolineae bacterium]|nr:Crp/Fnr family transcriptional regulator [Anaerolineae bacterium]HMR62478.1 Crp/Fnr family transcriptional regulator [Anaerolineae bacterium]